MGYNIYLREAAEKTVVKPTEVVSAIKKQLNTARLTRFSSVAECEKFYGAFFCQSLDDQIADTISVDDWAVIYNTLLTDTKFIDNISIYLVSFKPQQYVGMFSGLFNTITQQYIDAPTSKRLKILGTGAAIFSMLDMRFDAINVVVSKQVRTNSNYQVFMTTILQVLNHYDNQLNQMIMDELDQQQKSDEMLITKDLDADEVVEPAEEQTGPLAEDVQEILSLLENAQDWINQDIAKHQNLILDEGIVNNAKEKAKSAIVAAKRAEKNFDEFVMKKVREMRVNRRNRKHSELVGESLRISHEIKRILKSAGISVISPALGAIHYLVTLAIDKRTDKKDRAIIVADLKDEIEIVEEKIAMAERNGDDKERIELIRYRQKLYREYERINKVRYDSSRRMNLPNK